MSIKFICSCGKHLRARDEMAARRSFCPACGSPVGVPSLKPTHGGTDAAPLSPAERRARARQRQQEPIPADEPAEEVVWPAPRRPARPEDLDLSTGPRTPLDPSVVRQVGQEKPKQRRQLEWTFETRWPECVVYAFRAAPVVMCIAVALLTLSTGLAAWLEKPPQDELPSPWAVYLLALLPVMVLGYTCGFLQCTLAGGAAGEVEIRWPEGDLVLVLRSMAIWLVCFLAGPVLPLVGAYFYWLNCGDPDWVDRVILVELVALSVGYWVLAVLAVTWTNRLRDANPMRIAALARRLGYRAEAAVVLTTVLVLAHGWVVVRSLEQLNSKPQRFGPETILLPVVGMFVATFLFRLLGVWCHHCGVHPPTRVNRVKAPAG